MSMREIEIFRAVMTAGSTSKAAGLMGISQPAVSQGILRGNRTPYSQHSLLWVGALVDRGDAGARYGFHAASDRRIRRP